MKLASLAAVVAVIVIGPAAKAQATASAAKTAAAAKYHRDMPAKLVKEAKITEEAAAATALAAVPNGKIDKMELEKEDGKFIYSYDIKVAGKKGVQEVHVDAMTGALISNAHETPADEKAEKAKEAKEAKGAAAIKPKKP